MNSNDGKYYSSGQKAQGFCCATRYMLMRNLLTCLSLPFPVCKTEVITKFLTLSDLNKDLNKSDNVFKVHSTVPDIW